MQSKFSLTSMGLAARYCRFGEASGKGGTEAAAAPVAAA